MNHIAHRNNARAQIARENANMDQMERNLKPVMILLLLLAVAVIGNETLTERAAFYSDLEAARSDAKHVSAAIAACANGQRVKLDNDVLVCKIVKGKA